MRKIAFTLATTVLALGAAGVTMAASPAASGAQATSHTPSPSPSASTSPAIGGTTSGGSSSSAGSTGSTGSGASSAAAKSWSAAITPLNVTTGTTTVLENANGTGTLTVTLSGLRPDAAWTVDIDAGTIANARETTTAEIAYRSGMGVEKLSSDTFRVHLTVAEMKDFLAARTGKGVVVLVSDGTNRSAATFKGA